MLGVVSVIAFRLILIATMFQATKTFPEFFQKYARVMATGVAAFINAIIIEVKYISMMVHPFRMPFKSKNSLYLILITSILIIIAFRSVDSYFK